MKTKNKNMKAKAMLGAALLNVATIGGGVVSCKQPTDPNPTPAPTPTEKNLQVSITGRARVGEQLVADVVESNITGDKTFTWKRGNTIISGATGNKYNVESADEGAIISVTVTADGLTATYTMTEQIAPSNELRGEVRISGDAYINQTLTADLSRLRNIGDVAPTYSWKVAGTQVSTSSTYWIRAADDQKQITLAVSYSDREGTKTSNPTTIDGYRNLLPIMPAFSTENWTTSHTDAEFTGTFPAGSTSIVVALTNVFWDVFPTETIKRVAFVEGASSHSVSNSAYTIKIKASDLFSAPDQFTLESILTYELGQAKANQVASIQTKSQQAVRLANAMQPTKSLNNLFNANRAAVLQRNNRMAKAKTGRTYMG